LNHGQRQPTIEFMGLPPRQRALGISNRCSLASWSRRSRLAEVFVVAQSRFKQVPSIALFPKQREIG
jgi:hypothetical protein